MSTNQLRISDMLLRCHAFTFEWVSGSFGRCIEWLNYDSRLADIVVMVTVGLENFVAMRFPGL